MQYVFGAVLVIFPMAVFLYERYLISNGIEVDATVIGIEKTRGPQGRRYYHAVLSYQVDGKEYKTMEPTGVSLQTQAVGEVIRIIYHKENPNKIIAKSTSRIFAYALLFILFIVGVSIIANGFLNHLL